MQEAPDLVRAIECFNDAVLFVDVSQLKWKVLHMNAAAQTKLKLHDIAFSTAEGSESGLWDLFQVNASLQSAEPSPSEAHAEDIKHGRKFEIPSVISQIKSRNSTPQPVFNLTFRWLSCAVIAHTCLMPIKPILTVPHCKAVHSDIDIASHTQLY